MRAKNGRFQSDIEVSKVLASRGWSLDGEYKNALSKAVFICPMVIGSFRVGGQYGRVSFVERVRTTRSGEKFGNGCGEQNGMLLECVLPG